MMPITGPSGPSLPISQIKWKPAKVNPLPVYPALPGSTGRRVEKWLLIEPVHTATPAGLRRLPFLPAEVGVPKSLLHAQIQIRTGESPYYRVISQYHKMKKK